MNELAVLHSGLPTNIEDLTRFALVGREKLAAVRAEIRAIDKLKLADEVRAQKLDEAQMISEAVLDAEVKIGALLKDIPKETTNHKKPDLEKDTAVPFLTQKQQARDEICISRKQADRFVKLAENKDIVEQAKAEARDNDDIVSRSFVLEKIKSAERETKRAEIIENLESISAQKAKAIQGVYDVIVIDPPWDMKKIERDVTPNQSEFDYPTMTEQEIAQTKIPAADSCHMWLWTTHKYLPVALRLLETWGFKYVCTFVWHKNGGFQPFGLPQYNCEFALYARKGTPEFYDLKAFNTCFNAERGAHSEKPQAFYDMVRRVTKGRRIDMFSRKDISEFDVWGNEV